MVQSSKTKATQPSGDCCDGLQSRLSPKLFKALSDPKRLSLLVRLAESAEPCTVGRVAEGSGIDLSVVSRHLAILREAGVIRCEKQGKEVRCTVQTAPVAQFLRDLAAALEACCPGSLSEDDTAAAAPVARKARTRRTSTE